MTDAVFHSALTRLLDRRAFRLSLYALLGALLTVWSWRTWPDLLVDFGRELYVPWRLAEGATLYRDVASFFGPLSQNLNGLMFRLFGVSLMTIVVTNFVLLAVLIWLLDDAFARAFDGATAALTTCVFLTVFPFNQYMDNSSFNYIAPYAHEAVHGLILAVAVLVLLGRSLSVDSKALIAGAGLCFGLVHLTKPEPALAITAAVMFHFLLRYRDGQRTGRELGLFAAFAVVPWLVTFLFFSHGMDAASAGKATASTWMPLFTGASGGFFYQRTMGLDDPLYNALKALAAVGVFGLLVAGGLLLDRFARTRPKPGRPVAVVISVVLAAGLTHRDVFYPWKQIGRPLPLLVGALLVVGLWMLFRTPLEAERRRQHQLLLVWAVFAGAMLLKILFHVNLNGYGFTLAMPATLLVIAILFSSIPNVLRQRSAGGATFRWFSLCLTLSIIVVHLMWANRFFSKRDFPIGTGAERIMAMTPKLASRSAAVSETLTAIEKLVPPTATMAVFPEGVMLNYLTRRPTSTKYLNYMPPELVSFGEATIVAAHQANPPDFIVLMHKNTPEYGEGIFGQDPAFGLQLMQWVRQNYTEIWGTGPVPFTGYKVGARILQRRMPTSRTE